MTDNSISQGGPVKITINKGEGITYALKRLVEDQKMKLSDGKITAKEWNAAMDKLAEIQQARQAAKSQSIFSGGTDKTRAGWHNSFVVHPGQQIEFTKEEIDSLYKAMGASFTKGENPVVSADDTAGKDEKVDDKTHDKKTDAEGGENTSQKIVKEEIRKDENGTEYTASLDASGNVVKSTYKRKDGTLNVVKDYKDGKEVKYTDYAADGKTVSYINEYEYDSAGNKSKEALKSGDGTLSTVQDYKDGKRVKYTDYAADGKTVNFTEDYEYDSAGNKSKTTSKRGDGTLYYINEYKDGKEVKYIDYAADGQAVNFTREYEYDSAGNKSKTTRKRGDGTLSTVQDYKDGKEVKYTDYADDGKTVNFTEDYEYDSAGNKSKETLKRGDGTLIRIVENGELTMTRLYSKTETGSVVGRNYEFSDGVCVKSDFAEALHKQISGASLNKNTIALLKQLTPENVIKVLTSYKAMYNVDLTEDIMNEWGLDKNTVDEYIQKPLKERLENKLKVKASDESSLLETAVQYAADDTKATK